MPAACSSSNTGTPLTVAMSVRSQRRSVTLSSSIGANGLSRTIGTSIPAWLNSKWVISGAARSQIRLRARTIG
jgi:hypothetical protein